jgi:addiction module HigA family antidote
MKKIRECKHHPIHPGELLREKILPSLKLSQTEFAKRLGVSRLTVSELLLEKRAMSADMAVRVGRLTNTTPESWLRMQAAIDRQLLEKEQDRYRHIAPVAF